VGAIEAFEEDLGRPVRTANQVAFWSALRHARVRAPVAHCGHIFVEPLPADCRHRDLFAQAHDSRPARPRPVIDASHSEQILHHRHIGGLGRRNSVMGRYVCLRQLTTVLAARGPSAA